MSPKLMILPTKHACTLKGPYLGIEKVRKVTRKKRSQYMCEAQRTGNGLYILTMGDKE